MNIHILSIAVFAFIGVSCKKETSKQAVNPPVVAEPTPTDNDGASNGATLSADGTTDTYILINKVFGGTGDVTETPDCAHPAGAPHIQQVYDETLKRYAFAFTIHVTPDNDRCLPSTDRQRNEIKTYDRSPDSLLASVNETVKYSWKFKLDKDFKPSPNFTHIHQLKALDGDDDLPLITFTARYKSSGNKLELIHTGGTGKNTSLKYIASIPLADFMGEWVEVSETAAFSYNGKYGVVIKRISDGKKLLDLNIDKVDLWRDGTSLCRPKWGIYRSLLSPEYLRDETIRFNDFNITKIK